MIIVIAILSILLISIIISLIFIVAFIWIREKDNLELNLSSEFPQGVVILLINESYNIFMHDTFVYLPIIQMFNHILYFGSWSSLFPMIKMNIYIW